MSAKVYAAFGLESKFLKCYADELREFCGAKNRVKLS